MSGRPEAAVLTSLRKEPSRPHSAVDMRMEGRDGFAGVLKYVASRLRATASGLAAPSAPNEGGLAVDRSDGLWPGHVAVSAVEPNRLLVLFTSGYL
jgi:hypothetical protein